MLFNVRRAAEEVHDLLGFQPYAAALIRFLAECRTAPIIASVEGRWGSGKTHFLQLLECMLLSGDCRVVYFNAWRMSDSEEALWSVFLLGLIRSIRSQLKWHRRWIGDCSLVWFRIRARRRWLELSKFALLSALYLVLCASLIQVGLRGGLGSAAAVLAHQKQPNSGISGRGDDSSPLIQYLIGVTGGGGSLLIGVLLARRIVSLLGTPEPSVLAFSSQGDYVVRSGFMARVETDLVSIGNAYVPRGRIYVLIDDLDRCSASSMMRVITGLKQVSLNGRQPFTFVIAVDMAVVEACVASSYEKVLPLLPDSGPGQMWESRAGFGSVMDTSAEPPPMTTKATAFARSYLNKVLSISLFLPRTSPEGMSDFLGQDSPRTRVETGRSANTPSVQWDPDFQIPVRECIFMACQLWSGSPRQIVRFASYYRLLTYLAQEVGVLRRSAGGFVGHFTPEALGKFTAILLYSPKMFYELQIRPTLLTDLQSMVWCDSPIASSDDPVIQSWISDPAIVRLLRYGYDGECGESPHRRRRFDFTSFDPTWCFECRP